MKELFTLIVFLFSFQLGAQSLPPAAKPILVGRVAQKDTTIESDTSKENKEPRYFYLSLNTNIVVNAKGGFAKRFAPGLEFGRTYGIFDIGLSGGSLSSKSQDTCHYMEFRPTINVFSKGRFAEALCLAGDTYSMPNRV